jgi:hypothetical protein
MGRVIFRGPKRSYTFDDKDVEWLARSMWGEASTDAGRIAVAWTHINRFLLVNYRWLSEGWAFTAYVQGHSQPINPAWRRDGEFCRPGGKYYGNDTYCSEAQLAKRDKYQLGAVPASMMKLAEEFACGSYANPFNEPTYDFAADWLVKKQSRPCIGVVVGGNAHLTYGCLKESEQSSVIPGEVTVDGVRGGTIWKGLLSLWALATAYGLYRLLRG